MYLKKIKNEDPKIVYKKEYNTSFLHYDNTVLINNKKNAGIIFPI